MLLGLQKKNGSDLLTNVGIPGVSLVRKLKGVINGSVIREKRCKTESSF